MWVRSAAIRPVPEHARLTEVDLGAAEAWLGDDEEFAEDRLAQLFEQFERAQPALARRIGGHLSRRTDEVTLALGYFLSLVVWAAFERAFGSRLKVVEEMALASVEEALTLDEELRGHDPVEAVESDDVVAMEQPFALQFVHEHIEAALEAHASEADIDGVHAVYRLLLIEVLALSYAVTAPKGRRLASPEMHA